MADIGLTSFFAMGLALGCLHAFDPDHLAAVGGMTSGKQTRLWRTALHWSLGHGGVIFAIALLVFVFGAVIPTQLALWAELSVGAMLLIIGFFSMISIRRRFVHHELNTERGNSSATFVGMVHGTAGSAPLLTLIPISNIGEPTVGLVYVGLFCLGVTAAMAGIGGILGTTSNWLNGRHQRSFLAFHLFLALFAMAFGCYLLVSAFLK